MYPTLFIEYGFLRGDLKIVLDKYLEIKEDRIEAKHTGNKKKDKFLKLVLNSFSGLADCPTSWLYSPEEILALRVTGQLIQLRFIEELSELDGCSVFFTNTDGTTCKIRRDLLPEYYRIAKSIEKEFKVTWEFTINKKMIFSNTNSYLSIIEEEFMLDDNCNLVSHKTGLSKVKRKGVVFRYGDDIPLGDSSNMQVIPKALESYFLNGTDVSEFICNPEKYSINIFDYCLSKKVSKNWSVFWGNEQIQNVNRYFFSKTGNNIVKRENGFTKIHHLHKDCGVDLLNTYDPNKHISEYDINFNYYCSIARKLIKEMEVSKRQLSLFDQDFVTNY